MLLGTIAQYQLIAGVIHLCVSYVSMHNIKQHSNTIVAVWSIFHSCRKFQRDGEKAQATAYVWSIH